MTISRAVAVTTNRRPHFARDRAIKPIGPSVSRHHQKGGAKASLYINVDTTS